jgi:hypothetical protein
MVISYVPWPLTSKSKEINPSQDVPVVFENQRKFTIK